MLKSLPTTSMASTMYSLMPPVVDSNVHQVGTSVGGIVVSIAAFQAVDPGSIPGRRIEVFLLSCS